MSMRKTAKFLPVFALGLALSGCMAPPEEPAPLSNSSDTIVTPWGTPGQTPGPSAAKQPSAPQNDNLVMMEDPKRKAMDAITQKQIDEARIALGILDRMAQRCQAGDAAACATLQTNWNTLSQQLHKTLAIVSGSSMQAQPGIPTDDPAAAMPAPTSPSPSPSPSYVPPMNSPTDDQMPVMEKTIPMVQPGADG